jgi:hypothetical protein
LYDSSQRRKGDNTLQRRIHGRRHRRRS